jgi:hypothetical protein
MVIPQGNPGRTNEQAHHEAGLFVAHAVTADQWLWRSWPPPPLRAAGCAYCAGRAAGR